MFRSLLFLAFTTSLLAQTKVPNRPADQTIKIWQEGGWQGELPGAWKIEAAESSVVQTHMGGTLAIKDVSVPLVEYFQPAPAQAKDRAIIICPGGGYNILAWDLEGTEIATWLSGLGYHALVLKYRLPRKGDVRYAAALQDAQRAVSLVRSKSAVWKIAANKIGIMGFSAGGHLAALTSTSGNERSYEAKDDIDAFPCRTDFTGLIYSAYGIKGDAAVGEMAPEFKFSPQVPPAFLAHALDDGIPVANATAWLMALKAQKVPAELHVYPDGGHGYGLRSQLSIKEWPRLMEAWLQRL